MHNILRLFLMAHSLYNRNTDIRQMDLLYAQTTQLADTFIGI